MDFLKEAKKAAAELKSLNEKIARLTPTDADPAIGQLKTIYTGFLQRENTKTGTINGWFTEYKKYKKNANVNDLNTKIKSLLTSVKAASDGEVADCCQYLTDIETCTQGHPTLDYSSHIESIRTSVKIISTELAKTPLASRNIVTELQTIISELNVLANTIKSGKTNYATVEDAVVESGLQTKLKTYRDPLLLKFCKLFTVEATKQVVDAADYLGFTCCLAYIVLIMKITGTKVKKVTGLAQPQKVNDISDPSDKKLPENYKELLGSGWLATVIYNTLRAVLPPSDTSTMNSV